MDKETAINKIRKCLALAGSSEPHEAAAALRQAQKLMEQFGIENPDLLAAGISEEWAKAGASQTPPKYETQLAWVVGQAFHCEPMFSARINERVTAMVGGYVFIGAQPAPEVASYTFSVLRRKLAKARSEYLSGPLKRYRKNRTAAADKFCEGWVLAVYAYLDFTEPSKEHVEALEAYKRKQKPTTTLATRSRELTTGRTAEGHSIRGYAEGRKVKVHAGLGAGKTDAARLLN